MSTSVDKWLVSPDQRAFDGAIAEYDCWATQVHVLMLRKQGIISDDYAKATLIALANIEDEARKGNFEIDPNFGAQLTLEKMVVDAAGPDAGYSVHTGRSRNDQVLTAQKLFVRDRILEIFNEAAVLIEALIVRVEDSVDTVMPGYTHMQPARPTTVGQWFGAYADMFLRDLERMRDTWVRHNTSPLGAAESYGTSWPLDREMTQEALAFDSVDEIPMQVISNRGESDTDFLAALSFLTTHISKMAADGMLFTTFEYGYANLSEKVAERMGKLTGSSIMPQKKNPDVLELLRAQVSEVHSYLFHCLELLKALPMGYNRDSRDTKGPIIRGTAMAQMAVSQLTTVVVSIEFDEERMLAAVEGNYCMATDLAEFVAQRCRIPFRIVHGIVGNATKDAIAAKIKLKDIDVEALRKHTPDGYSVDLTPEELSAALDPRQAVQRRQNIGGPGGDRMTEWQKSRSQNLAELRVWGSSQTARISDARSATRSQIETIAKT